MAVDAQRLFGLVGRAGAAMPMSGASAAAFSPCYGAAVQQQQGYLSSSSSYMGLVHAPPPTLGLQDQYTEFLALPAADLAKRGVRLDGSQSQQMIAGQVPGTASVLEAHAQQHAANIAEQRKKHMELIISTAEARAAKRLRAKDEEIDRIRSVNWVLQERLRNLQQDEK